MTKENYTNKANIELVAEVSKIDVPIRELIKYLKKNNIGLYSEIINRTEFLDNGAYKGKTVPILYRLYCLEHNLTSSPTCSHPNCNNPVKWDCTRRLPSAFCCRGCNNSDPNMVSRVKQAILNKYGVENVLQSKEIKDKIRNTNLEKYGVEWSTQRSDVKEKVSSTKMNYTNERNNEINEKRKTTCLEKYGVEYVSQNDDVKKTIIQSKRIKTLEKNSGVKQIDNCDDFVCFCTDDSAYDATLRYRSCCPYAYELSYI